MVIKVRGKFDSVCVKDGKFRFLNDVWLSPVGMEMCPRLSLPLQASFWPELFQASLFQLEEPARGRRQAKGMVLGAGAGAGLSSGMHGDIWRSAEQGCSGQAGLGGEGKKKPLESFRTLSHCGKTDLVGDSNV